MENFWKKHIKWIIPVALIFILATSIYTYFRSQKTNTLDAWASFWSGIFGTIASVVIAVWIMQRQIREESKNRRKDEESRKNDNIDNTFFNLLEIHIDNQKEVSIELIQNIKTKIVFHSNQVIEKIFFKNLESILPYIIEDINSSINKISETFETKKNLANDYINKLSYDNLNLSIALKDLKSFTMEKTQLSWTTKDTIENNKHTLNKEIIDFYNLCYKLDRLSVIISELSDNKSNLNYQNYNRRIDQLNYLSNNIQLSKNNSDRISIIIKKEYSTIDFQQKQEIVSSVLKQYHGKIGLYLRMSYRIIKYVKENVEDSTVKNNYFGIFRATMNESHILLLFYNSSYSKSGDGMREKLIGTNFFGKSDECVEDSDTEFIRYSELIFGNDDIKLMKEYCS
ncbi:hypothetical protein IGK74_001094 [Enterococcus sp. AZ150]|uniref:putative phage abortive infection protein n=1 Tax=Enterococcus sp. AZ150 TaxID=2774866 RepID=UPI003F283902